MAEEYNIQAIMNDLKEKEEMDPDKHDGCYELMRETISAYAKLDDFSVLDYKDLNLVYLTTVGTWKQGIEGKKKHVIASHLLPDDKEYLTMLWDEVWEKAGRREYENNESAAIGGMSIGLFGTGFFSFQRTTTSAHVQAFIKMCVDILPMTDDIKMFDRAASTLTSSFQGMRSASASMILHCLKPFSFPILNGNTGLKNIFEILGVQIEKINNLDTYIDNCRRIKAFRDQNFTCKNYRVYDAESFHLDKYLLVHEYDKFDSWEVVNENVAMKNCDKSFFQFKGSSIPKAIRWFFEAESINAGDKLELVLEHDGGEYDARIQYSDDGSNQMHIFWDDALAEKFEPYANDGVQHLLEFQREGDSRYRVQIVQSSAGKAWLLTWNKNKWDWKDFDEKCESTKNGNIILDSWACANSNAKVGDEFFLIKLGDQPRGIIGHGRVTSGQYEKEHYDNEKAAAGIKEKAIDVEFDRLINYENDKFITQDELNEKCTGQHWSPQASGIEIKPEVLPTLKLLWDAVVKYGITKIVSFIANYAGKKYIDPKKAGDQAEYMSRMKKSGQEARQLFINFIKDAIKDIPDLEYVSCSNWVNQGQIVQNYIWIELKKQEWKDYPNSVSVSIEKNEEVFGDEIGITVRAETKDNASDDEDYKRQFRLLDCDLLDEMTYLAKDKSGELHYNDIDNHIARELYETGAIIKLEVIEVIKQLTRNENTILAETKKAIKEIYPLYEYVMSDTKKTDEGEWWPSQEEYPVNLSKDDWKRFIQEIEMPKHKGCMRVLSCFIDIGGLASPRSLSDRYKGHPSVYVGSVVNTGRRAIDYFGMAPCSDGDAQRYFPIAFQGRHGKGDSAGTYEYKMRPELFEALREMDLSGIELIYKEGGKSEMSSVYYNHNMILYGPPGTGKTYHSVIYAVAICDNRSIEDLKKEPYSEVLSRYKELKEDGRITFTTFHQSYGYEEFIEGIKPRLNSESETLGYTIEDGVFKVFCKRAGAVKVQDTGTHIMKEKPRIWGMLLGGTGKTELKKRCFDKNEIRLGWSEIQDDDVDGDYVGDDNASWNAKHMVDDFKNTMEIGDIVVIEKDNTSIDAIGVVTGEYRYDSSNERYPRSRTVEWLVKDIDQDVLQYLPNGRKQLSRFSVFAFDYIGMDAISQIINENTTEPVVEVDQETKPFVFIIDEINRGNISKIFGELITLIEDTKRSGATEAMEAILPYSGELFSVPNNVYILGTMNTADRSIALMDTALRRRFEFVEMMPNTEVLESLGVGTIVVGDEELNVAKMLDVINERIEYLFDREHTIGHAFFTKLADDPSIDTLAGIFEKNVIPLLQEYFYEDYEKIQLVLGDNEKEDEFKFILDKKVELKQIFKGNPDIDLPPKGYSIQKSAFRKLQSYKLIGKEL